MLVLVLVLVLVRLLRRRQRLVQLLGVHERAAERAVRRAAHSLGVRTCAPVRPARVRSQVLLFYKVGTHVRALATASPIDGHARANAAPQCALCVRVRSRSDPRAHLLRQHVLLDTRPAVVRKGATRASAARHALPCSQRAGGGGHVGARTSWGS